MHQISTKLVRLLATAVVGAAVLAAVATAPAADAAVPKSGTWTGEVRTLYLSGQPGFNPKMVLEAWNGRISSVTTTARLECPTALTIQDIRVIKSWRIGRGPLVNRRGGFKFTVKGVYFHGILSRSSAIGGASMTRGTYGTADYCRAKGIFNLQRKKSLW
jgi:hypothetical protein